MKASPWDNGSKDPCPRTQRSGHGRIRTEDRLIRSPTFLVGLSANGVKTDVRHKSLSHRDAVPPMRTCCCPFLQENCRQESPGVALNRQPLLQNLLDCMDCFRISEVVFPVGCSTVICSAAIFSWAITVL